MKKCTKCKISKELTEFYYVDKSWCKSCHREANNKVKKKNKVYQQFDITHIANIDLGFKEGYRDRIEEWFYKDVLPGLNELWMKSKLYKEKN